MIEELESDAGGREPRNHQRQPQASAAQGQGVVWLSPQTDPGLGLPGGPWGTQGELSAHTAPPAEGEGEKNPGSPSSCLPRPLAPPRAGAPQEMTQTPFTQGLFQDA